MLTYPDISNNNPGYTVTKTYPIVCAKASEGATFRDPLFARFVAEAKAAGVYPFAYHWLHSTPVADQVANCCAMVPPGMPVMIDWEDTADVATPTQAYTFARGMEAAGRPTRLLYLPEWFWSGHLGSPDLSPFRLAGMRLVSSNYTGNPNAPAGYVPYGGMTPAVYQYTDTPIDMNAYAGTAAQFIAMIGGTPPVTAPPRESPMLGFLTCDNQDPADPAANFHFNNGMTRRPISRAEATDWADQQANSVPGQGPLWVGTDSAWMTMPGYGKVVRYDPRTDTYAGVDIVPAGTAGTVTISGTLNVS